MKTLVLFILMIFEMTHASSVMAEECQKVSNKAEDSLQLIVVTSPSWREKTGTLRRYERKHKTDRWIPVDAKFEVVIGKNGMGWGKDFAELSKPTEPKKKEGDGKAPAGLFAMGITFGFEDPKKIDLLKPTNYRQLKDSTYCVDDQNSDYYNQIIDSSDPKITSNPPHNEKMRDQELYKIGAEIKYGSSRTLGTGSCIFMHIWRNSTQGTEGCVAMKEENIQKIVKWLNPKLNPAIAIFPQAAYNRVKSCFKLP